MIEICEGCRELQFLVLYLSNINNEALAAVGRCLPKLTDFRIVLLEVGNMVSDYYYLIDCETQQKNRFVCGLLH
jgi:coronatine-insensitive protein 1